MNRKQNAVTQKKIYITALPARKQFNLAEFHFNQNFTPGILNVRKSSPGILSTQNHTSAISDLS